MKLSKIENDPHSYANFDKIRTSHLSLRLRIDFQSKQIEGEVTHQLKRVVRGVRELVLDTSNLEIISVVDSRFGVPLNYKIADPHPVYGSKLSIEIGTLTEGVKIRYRTSPDANAIQWLEPELTFGQSKPMLFTQSQAIRARSWIPVQDTPAVRASFHATVSVDPSLGLVALMSSDQARPTHKKDNGIYHFEMSKPIPSYLMALAVGNFEYRALGGSDFIGIYAEPEMIDRAAYEFDTTPSDVAQAEAVLGSYQKLWGRYDMLLLPPSFPYGGMENPGLVYIAPTVIAGDRSLINVVTHELAHSWSGNLVTNANMNYFFLNEGLTQYFEMYILEQTGRTEMAKLNKVLCYEELLAFLKEENNGPSTVMVPDLREKDPDDFPSAIAYNKGMFFFFHIEQKIGKPRTLEFLQKYLKKRSFQSVTVSDFVSDLEEYVIQGNESLRQELNLDEWFYAPGLPLDHPVPDMTPVTELREAVQLVVAGDQAVYSKLSHYNSKQKELFLELLPKSGVAIDVLQRIDNVWQLSQSKNRVIAALWFRVAISNGLMLPLQEQIVEFLTHVGRRYLVRYVVEALRDQPDGLQIVDRALNLMAQKTAATIQYHPATLQLIKKLIAK